MLYFASYIHSTLTYIATAIMHPSIFCFNLYWTSLKMNCQTEKLSKLRTHRFFELIFLLFVCVFFFNYVAR
jgi:hypothetical protein